MVCSFWFHMLSKKDAEKKEVAYKIPKVFHYVLDEDGYFFFDTLTL